MRKMGDLREGVEEVRRIVFLSLGMVVPWAGILRVLRTDLFLY